MSPAPSWTRVIPAAALLILLFGGLGRLPLLDPDEGRYARTAQEMMGRGDLVVPYLDGQPRLQKPVLLYWLEAGAFALLGYTETAARLPSALAAAATLLWLYLFARRRAGESAALLACAILATTPLFFALARVATTDMVLTFFVFGATASLYAGIVEPVRRRRDLWIAGICLGLGMLTKGPVVLMVPFLVVAAGAVARRRAPITVAGRLVGVAWVMVAVALPWAVLLFYRVGWEEALEIWRQEALERLSSGLDHPESPFYLVLTSPVTFFPWSAFVPWALIEGFRRRRRGDAWRPALLAWILGPFLFWTVSRGKLDSYLLPVAPGVALLVATALAGRPGVRSEHSTAAGEPHAGGAPGLRWGVWLLTVMAVLALLPYPVTRMIESTPAALPAFSLVAAACALVLALLSQSGRGRTALKRGSSGADAPEDRGPGHGSLAAPYALATAFGAALLITVLALPVQWADRRSTRALVSGMEPLARDEPLYLHRLLAPSLSFYTDRVPVAVPARYLLMGLVDSGGPATVVLEERRRRAVDDLLSRGFEVKARSGGRLLLRRPSRLGP